MSLVTGSDESHWQQATLAFARERKAAGDKFAIYKSRDGLHLDPAAGQHYHNFTAVGMAVGSYIFYRSKVDPIDQANGLLAAAVGLHLPFGLWLDYEGASGMDSAADLYAFMSTLDDGTAWTVGIYGARDMLAATIGHDARFARFPIWHPEYPAKWADGSATPATITTKAGAPWSRTPDVWQFTDSRKASVGLDRNVCTQAAFDTITGHHEPAPIPKGPLMALSDKEQTELLTKVRDLHADYAVSREAGTNGPKDYGTKRWQIGKVFNAVVKVGAHDRAANDALGKGG